MMDQSEIHKMALSDRTRDQRIAIQLIRNNFSNLIDKKQVWDDLIHLSQNRILSIETSKILGDVFPFIPHQEQAWNDLIRRTQNRDKDVFWVINSIECVFPHIIDKEEAWMNILTMTQDKDKNVRCGAAITLGAVFVEVPDKQKAWNELHIMTHDEESDVRGYAALGISIAFSVLPDKKKAWNDLIELTHENNERVMESVAFALGLAFEHISDKEQAWNDLHNMTLDKDKNVRWIAAFAIYEAIFHIPNQKQACGDIHRLTLDDENKVRTMAALSIGTLMELPRHNEIFKIIKIKEELNINRFRRPPPIGELPLPTRLRDKDDFIHSTHKEGNEESAKIIPPETFFEFLEQKQAWEDLHRLTQDKEKDVRKASAIALCIALPNLYLFSWDKIPGNDNQRLIEYLERTYDIDWVNKAKIEKIDNGTTIKVYSKKKLFSLKLNDEKTKVNFQIDDHRTDEFFVRSENGELNIYQNLTDPEQAWQDLHRLVQDKDKDVKKSALKGLFFISISFPDKEEIYIELNILIQDNDLEIRSIAGIQFLLLAQHFIDNTNYKKAYECFNKILIALKPLLFKFRLRNYLKPSREYYYFKGLCFYYHGKALVSELPEIEDHEKYMDNIKEATILFNKSIKNIEKFSDKYDEKMCYFHICLNVYSAYYEYNLSFKEVDEKRISKHIIKIQNYLNDANKRSEILSSEKGKTIIKIFEKLTTALISRLNEIKQETKKSDVSKVKGWGDAATFNSFIKKSNKSFEKNINELDILLNESVALFIKEIIQFEIERLKEIKPEKEKIHIPKTFWNQSYDCIVNTTKGFWKIILKIIVTIGLILATLVEIIKNWDFISALFKF